MQKVHEFKVGMSCGGCSSAVQRVLDRLKGKTLFIFVFIVLRLMVLGKGVNNVEINLETQIVKVTSTLSSDEILEVLKKTGKTVEYIKSS